MTEKVSSIEVVDACFRNPPFWDRNVVFFANLMSLFFGNDEQTEELAAEVGEIDSYGGRLLPILDLIYRGGSNVLVLEREPEPALCDYFTTRLGLTLPQVATLSNEDYRKLAFDRIDHRLHSNENTVHFDGYATDSILEQWADSCGCPTVSTASGSRRGNNKLLLHEHLAKSGLPTPDSSAAATSEEVAIALSRLAKIGYRKAVARSAIGASGIGIQTFDLGRTAAPLLPEHFFYEGPCLVQGWLEPGGHGIESVSSPSVQLFLDEEKLHLFDTTEQILSEESVHEGNYSPPTELEAEVVSEMKRQAAIVGQWLHRQGFRGTASADFLVTRLGDDKPTAVYVCELNARVTGATYPSVLARHLRPGGSWLLRNLRLERPITGHRLLALIEDNSLLFSRGDLKGVIPINFNFGEDSLIQKGQFLFVGEELAECRSLLDRLVGTLPLQLTVTRD